MGKLSKAQEAALQRQHQEERRRAEAEKLKRQNRLFWLILLSVLTVIVLAVVLTSILTSDKKDGGSSTVTTASQTVSADFSEVDPALCTETAEETDYVKLNVTYVDGDSNEHTGDIVVRLYPDIAPITVTNFKNLVKNGSYDGTTFHRVYPGFMVQGGAIATAESIVGEFSANGYTNNLKHVRGVLSMARATSYNSASSQFFIMHDTASHLDGNYAAFGYVVSGMDVVDGIANTPATYSSSDRANTTPVVQPVINSAVFVTVAE